MKLFTKPLLESPILRRVAYLMSLVKFAAYGVEHGPGLRAIGVNLANVGSIKLGKRVRLFGRAHGNPYRTSLRTYFPEARIEIGDDCESNGAIIHCNCSVTIGPQSWLGPGVIVCDNDSHPPVRDHAARFARPPEAPITIGRNVWLGMRVIVMKGVSIGDNTIVAPGSIVTKSLPPDSLAAGIPARVLRRLE